MTAAASTAEETARYRRDGYVALPGLFPTELLRVFYRQLDADLRAGGRSFRDFMTRGPLLTREAIEIYGYQYQPLTGFLWGLTPRMAAVAGCALLPTYCYFRLYQKGDVCLVHSDRPACEHSLSLTMASPDDHPWALSVETEASEPSAKVTPDFGDAPFGSVPMRAGDAVAYQGTHRRHGRLDGNPNAWSAHLFLHWVEQDGRYAEQAFDRPTMDKAQAAARR